MDLKSAGIRYYERVPTSEEISEYQVSKHEVGAFRLTESKFASGYRLGKHSHEYGCFFIVLKGTLTEFYGKKSRECRPLSMTFSPPDEAHSDNFHNAGGHCFILEVAPHWLERSRQHSLMLNDSGDFYG